MADAKRNDAWDQTASLIASINNSNASQRSQLRSPLDFHPFRKPAKAAAVQMTPKQTVQMLRGILGTKK